MTSKYEVNTFDATGVCKKKLNITHKTEWKSAFYKSIEKCTLIKKTTSRKDTG